MRHRIVASPDAFPDSVAARIREIADTYPDAKHEIAGGLSGMLEGERERERSEPRRS